MSEATQTPTLEQSLNKTDFGHLVYENRKIFFAALIAVIVAVTGYVGWKQNRKSTALNNSVKVFEFQSGPWTEAKAGKITTADLVKAFEGLEEGVRNAPVMLPIVLDMGKFLYEKGSYTEAEVILSKVDAATKHPVSSFFVKMQRVVVLEKLGKTDEAISVLEPLAQNKETMMPAKISVELGRFYLIKGDKTKAKTQFDFVISTYPNDDQAKLAKLYLSQTAQ